MKGYNLEKEKASLITAFDRVLSEHTPCTSILDPDILVEYLQNISLKASMMNEELRRIAHEMATFKKDEALLSLDAADLTILEIEKVEELEKTIKLDAEQMDEVLTKNKALNSDLTLANSSS